MQTKLNLFNEESSNQNDENKMEILQLPATFKHSNYFISNIINLKDTYTTKIFIGLIAGWNKAMYSLGEISDDFYSKENLSVRNKTIEIKTSTFLKQIGIADSKGKYDTILLKKSLDHFNKNSTLDIELIKENNPVLYENIKNIILSESKSKKLNMSFINLFSSIYQSIDEPGLPSYIGFNLTNEAVPIFDAIAKNYTLVSLKSIAVLNKPSLKLYDFLKAILGNRTEYQYKLWLEPSESNSNIYNLRTILDYLETTQQGRYKYRGNDLISKTLECFKEINEKCEDLYIDFNFDKNSEDYENQFIKKGVKYQGINLKIFSYNPNNKSQSLELINKYKNCLIVKDEYINNDFPLEIIKKEVEQKIITILNVLESEKFKNKYWNKRTMTTDTFLELKRDYIDLCYSYAKANYYDQESNHWRCNLTKMMIFYLLKGKNIYDGQLYKTSKYTNWTPGDDVDNFSLKNPADNPNYIEEQIEDEIPSFVKDFLKQIK